MSTHRLARGSKGPRISPGHSRTFLETRAYAQGIKVRLPVLTVEGARRGPLAVVMAGQHGRELNGIAAIERVFGLLRPSAMSGRVVFLPVMNPPAVRMRRQDYPVEEEQARASFLISSMAASRPRRAKGEISSPMPMYSAGIVSSQASGAWPNTSRARASRVTGLAE